MIIIYGKNACPYCQMAKNLCETANIDYQYVDIFSSPENEKNYNEFREKYNHMTVPLVMNGETFIGGFTELQGKVMAKEL